MNRREYLITLSVALSGSLGGCTDLLDNQDDQPFYIPWIAGVIGDATLNVVASKVSTQSHSDGSPATLGLDLEMINATIQLGAWPEYGEDTSVIDLKVDGRIITNAATKL